MAAGRSQPEPSGLFPQTIAELAGVAYKERPWDAVVLIEVENGRLFGASDPRQPAGAAVAY
jgi:hypothetical protein